jgi:putative solute:sodium symporter small subunit
MSDGPGFCLYTLPLAPVNPQPDKTPLSQERRPEEYWKANLRLVAACLVVWFTVSFLFGILWVDTLNTISMFGFKLGFWFAQQGSIYVFLVLIFFYSWRMNILDKKYGVEEQETDQGDTSGGS